MHIYKRKIFGYECDLYGHLNNAKYLNICEEARSDALEQTDYSVNDLYELGIYMFVRNANIQFIKSIPVGSEITIRSKVVKYTRLRSIWEQKLIDAQNEVCSIITIDVIFTKDNKPKRLPKNVYKNFGKQVLEDND